MDDGDDEGVADYELKSRVFWTTADSCHMEMDLSDMIGGFNPIFLIYLRDLNELDISGCSSLPTLKFVDCVGAWMTIDIQAAKISRNGFTRQ